jgi:hypothetical protein
LIFFTSAEVLTGRPTISLFTVASAFRITASACYKIKIKKMVGINDICFTSAELLTWRPTSFLFTVPLAFRITASAFRITASAFKEKTIICLQIYCNQKQLKLKTIIVAQLPNLVLYTLTEISTGRVADS